MEKNNSTKREPHEKFMVRRGKKVKLAEKKKEQTERQQAIARLVKQADSYWQGEWLGR